MKTIVSILVLLLVGVSFAAGVAHGRGELAPAVEAKVKAAKEYLLDKLARYIPFFGAQ